MSNDTSKKEVTKLVEKQIGIRGIIVKDFWRSDAGIRVVFRLSKTTTIEDQISLDLTDEQMEKVWLR